MQHTDEKQPETHTENVLSPNKTFFSPWRAGCCSDEEGLPGWARVSPSVAMATRYFPTFLVLLVLSSCTLLLLTLLPSVAPSIPFRSSSLSSRWSSPSCGLGQSWAVRLHAGPHHGAEDGEQGSVHLDAIANRVQNFMNTLCRQILIFYRVWPKTHWLIYLFWHFQKKTTSWRLICENDTSGIALLHPDILYAAILVFHFVFNALHLYPIFCNNLIPPRESWKFHPVRFKVCLGHGKKKPTQVVHFLKVLPQLNLYVSSLLSPSQVAQQAGLQNRGQIGQLEGHYLLCSVEPATGTGVWSEGVHPGDVLAAHPHVLWHSQERQLSRSKRSMAFNDPLYPKQWHLVRI